MFAGQRSAADAGLGSGTTRMFAHEFERGRAIKRTVAELQRGAAPTE